MKIVKRMISSHPIIAVVLALLAVYLVIIAVPINFVGNAEAYRTKSDLYFEKARQADCSKVGKMYYRCVSNFGDSKMDRCDEWREQSLLYIDYYQEVPEIDCLDDNGMYEESFLDNEEWSQKDDF